MKEVEWTHAARKTLTRVDHTLAQRVVRSVLRFAESGHGDVKKLKGSDEYRLRVGDWRVRFRDEGELMVVVSVKHRGSAYR